MTPNQKAFLDMIAYSEGTYNIGDRGYNCLVGSTPKHPLLFDSYADHPRIYNAQFNSTAAGRYQLLGRWFDAYKELLKLPDFSPASQDSIALQQIKERRAFDDIEDGNIGSAVAKCSNIWASLPGSNYGQHVQNLEDLLQAYIEVGGILA
jgi:muramidase (phage lysozyme)